MAKPDDLDLYHRLVYEIGLTALNDVYVENTLRGFYQFILAIIPADDVNVVSRCWRRPSPTIAPAEEVNELGYPKLVEKIREALKAAPIDDDLLEGCMLTLDAALSAHTHRGIIVHSQWTLMEDQPGVIFNTTPMGRQKKKGPDLSDIEKFKKSATELTRVYRRVSVLWLTVAEVLTGMPSSNESDRRRRAILRNNFTITPDGGAKPWPSAMK